MKDVNRVCLCVLLFQNWAAQYWVQNGAPRSKINIGVPLYGRSFRLPYSHTDELVGCKASGAGQAGTYTREAGFLAWYEVSHLLLCCMVLTYFSEPDILGKFYAIFSEGDKFCNFLFASLHTKPLLKRICSKRKEFAPKGSKFLQNAF